MSEIPTHESQKKIGSISSVSLQVSMVLNHQKGSGQFSFQYLDQIIVGPATGLPGGSVQGDFEQLESLA